ncbi:hypothetical protein [Burkholderia pseudomultivorans]|uniref:hypothetical protein n=1 Tax=Burkholderia pseudomultivorans TaxID=1207504 RepID=UPI000ACB38E0|nr:hypothetical protein [Burkholderia pseudomultivorans]
MSWRAPTTFEAWERELVDYFLRVDSTGESTDIRSFEITPATLAAALGAPADAEDEVAVAFQRQLQRDNLFVQSLSSGSQRFSSASAPNFFVYLAATLFVDSLLDGEYHSAGAYRERLALWLESHHTFVQLKGIADMWEELREWLARRVNAGDGFRRLVLPDPGGWTQIGYTRRLSFPNRSDARMARNFLLEQPQALDSPLATINLFQRFRIGKTLSWGLAKAFDEFEHAYFQQKRALADHRFWRLITEVGSQVHRLDRRLVEIDMLYEEDESRIYIADSSQDDGGRVYQTLHDALTAENAAQSANFSASCRGGLLFFRHTGMGRWSLDREIRDVSGEVIVVVSTSHRRAIGGRLGNLREEKDWIFTSKPIAAQKAIDVLRTAGFAAFKSDQVFRASANGGIRVGVGWLGRQAFLPRLESDSKRHHVIRSEDATGAFEVTPNGQLESAAHLDGSFTISPGSEHGDRHSDWSLRLTFSSQAVPHSICDGGRYRLERLNDWQSEKRPLHPIKSNEQFLWENGALECLDLLEAVYASGAAGWEEAALIHMLSRASDEMNSWSLLQILRDGGIIEPRLRGGWRGRSWTLVPPRLLELPSSQHPIVQIEGALCERLVDRFRLVVEARGGTCFRRLGIGPWAPPTIGATGLAAADIAAQLDWPIVPDPESAVQKPLAFQSTPRIAIAYEAADFWDWGAKRFLKRSEHRGTTTLTRLIHKAQRDHDLFEVTSSAGRVLYLSRTAAIAAAHAAAKVPLFEERGDALLRISNDGALPNFIAADLRRRAMRCAGMMDGLYVYPALREDLRGLARLLPSCILLSKTEATEDGFRESLIRRSEGRFRTQWLNGRLTI